MSNAYRSVLKSGGVTPTGDAVAGDVLTGKTFSNANAVGVSGTMPNRGAVSETLSLGDEYTVPEGYHNGSGKVSASSALTVTNLANNHTNNTGTISTSYTVTSAVAGRRAILISVQADKSYIGNTITMTLNGTDIKSQGNSVFPSEYGATVAALLFDITLAENDILAVTYTQSSSTSSYLAASIDLIS